MLVVRKFKRKCQQNYSFAQKFGIILLKYTFSKQCGAVISLTPCPGQSLAVQGDPLDRLFRHISAHNCTAPVVLLYPRCPAPCVLCPVPGVQPQVSCPRCPVPGVLPQVSCLGFPALCVLPRLSCHGCPIPVDLSQLSAFAVMSLPFCILFFSWLCYPDCLLWLTYPDCPGPAVLSRLSYPAVLSQLYYPNTLWLSSPVVLVLTLLPCPGRPVLSAQSRLELSRRTCPTDLFTLTCPGPAPFPCPRCPVVTALSWLSVTVFKSVVLSQLSCPCCHVLLVLYPLLFPGCTIHIPIVQPVRPVPALLSQMSFPSITVPSSLSPPSCPCCHVLSWIMKERSLF